MASAAKPGTPLNERAAVAGPELDRAVHVRVFQMGGNEEVHPYSTDAAWARIVVNRMRALGWQLAGGEMAAERRVCRFVRSLDVPPGVRHADELAAGLSPLAICVAALRALQTR